MNRNVINSESKGEKFVQMSAEWLHEPLKKNLKILQNNPKTHSEQFPERNCVYDLVEREQKRGVNMRWVVNFEFHLFFPHSAVKCL